MVRGTRVVLALGLVFLAVGCSSSGVHASGGPTAGASCGATRSGANVPVIIKVVKGDVDCGIALKVENDYATAVKRGELRGNGGGAPLQVDGWTCQGYPTPEVLRTGNASECHSGSSEILAVLNLAASSATASPAASSTASASATASPTAPSATASAG